MEANLLSPVRGPQRAVVPPIAVAPAVLAANATVGLLGLVLFGRRVAGGLQNPAPAGLLLLMGVLCCTLSGLGRRLWRREVRPRQSIAAYSAVAWEQIVGWAPTVGILLLTFGLSWPMPRLVDWLVWIPLWAADAWWRKSFFAGKPLAAPAANGRAGPGPVHPQRKRESPSVCQPEIDFAEGDGIVLQQLTRFRDLQAQESILGSLRAEIAPGQRTAELYVGFCPPFARIPTIELEQSDGPPARIGVGQVLAHGARIDIRLTDAPATPEEVCVELFAAG